jgi:hypothetical protein
MDLQEEVLSYFQNTIHILSRGRNKEQTIKNPRCRPSTGIIQYSSSTWGLLAISTVQYQRSISTSCVGAAATVSVVAEPAAGAVAASFGESTMNASSSLSNSSAVLGFFGPPPPLAPPLLPPLPLPPPLPPRLGLLRIGPLKQWQVKHVHESGMRKETHIPSPGVSSVTMAVSSRLSRSERGGFWTLLSRDSVDEGSLVTRRGLAWSNSIVIGWPRQRAS